MHFLKEASQSAAIREYTPEHPPTDEQQAIIDAATKESDNLLVNALAGAAKTSTLVMVANQPALQQVPILCLAFNKKIAEEMRTRLPSNCTAMTLNALGHKVWSQAIGRRCRVNVKKNFEIMKGLIETQRKDIKDKLYENLGELMRTMSHAKASGWIPDDYGDGKGGIRLINDANFFASLDEELEPYEENILIKAIMISIIEAFEGNIDFDDQIFMSTLFPSKFPSYPLTLIDESQDLSLLNHCMLGQIVRDDRLIAVGDPCQAIYGFRGAHEESMSELQQTFTMKEQLLSTSFRCPKAVVKEAQWRAPHMNAPEWAKEGSVSTLNSWSISDLPSDAVIICRNNAPLFSIAIRLLSEGRYPQIVGNDIGKTLLKAMRKLGPQGISQEAALDALETYELQRVSKARNKSKVKDFCQCIRIFIKNGETLEAAMLYAEHIMTATGPIKLMTGHKSKGLEFRNVFILDRKLIRIDEEGQDRNLLYVMQTRAQENLTYITSDNFVAEDVSTLDEMED